MKTQVKRGKKKTKVRENASDEVTTEFCLTSDFFEHGASFLCQSLRRSKSNQSYPALFRNSIKNYPSTSTSNSRPHVISTFTDYT